MAAIESMRRRCQAVVVVVSRGSHTSYWQLLLLVIELFGTLSWFGVIFWNLHFGGSGENLHFWGSASLMTERMLPIVHIWYIAMKFLLYKHQSNTSVADKTCVIYNTFLLLCICFISTKWPALHCIWNSCNIQWAVTFQINCIDLLAWLMNHEQW